MSENNPIQGPMPDDSPILPPLPDGRAKAVQAARKAMERGTRGHDDWRPWYFDSLVQFCADPTQDKKLSGFCTEMGIDYSTAYRYMQENPVTFWTAVDSFRIKYHCKIREEVWKAIISNIKKSFNDRKLALQLIGDFVEKTETVTVTRSPEEKRARINELMDRLAPKGKQTNISGNE